VLMSVITNTIVKRAAAMVHTLCIVKFKLLKFKRDFLTITRQSKTSYCQANVESDDSVITDDVPDTS